MKVAINGFGRIGRSSMKALLKKTDIEVVAINDLTDAESLAHLFKYDTVYGIYPGKVSHDRDNLIINSRKIPVISEKDPGKLPWKEMEIDVVLESTGMFTEKDKAALHLEAGAKKVVISAPAKGDVKHIILGVNGSELTPEDNIVSNGSCTTNCLAPMVKILDDKWGVESGLMTTVHAFTSSQNLVDGPHKDKRRGRAAAHNIVPTTTGAAKLIGKIISHLDGKLNGMAMRVPVICGSIMDLTCVMKEEVSQDEVNQAFREAADNHLTGIVEYSDRELVSSDIVGNRHSCTFDAPSTLVTGKVVKTLGWYDNETGYSERIADLMEKIGNYVAATVER